MSKNEVDKALADQKALVDIRVRERRTRIALTSNLPKKKVKEYAQVLVDIAVKLRNAQERAFASFKKLSVIDQAIVLEKTQTGNFN